MIAADRCSSANHSAERSVTKLKVENETKNCNIKMMKYRNTGDNPDTTFVTDVSIVAHGGYADFFLTLSQKTGGESLSQNALNLSALPIEDPRIDISFVYTIQLNNTIK